jgi:hypothetical protein
LSEEDKQRLLDRVNSVGRKEIRLETVHILLCVMHEARETDQTEFLNEIFIPWHGLRRKTRPHFDRICDELVRIGEFEPGSVEEATHAVNVYRNIVSDLFDPYLSLIVACFQFKEGTFSGLDNADLGQGERSKFDYLAARTNAIFNGQPNFLSGYDPRVRNAISHSGAHGVTYGVGRVVFKNIKRGTPAIVETVQWTVEELQFRVIQLLECIQSIDVTVDIFGIDCSEVIQSDTNTLLRLWHHALSRESKKQLESRQDRLGNCAMPKDWISTKNEKH